MSDLIVLVLFCALGYISARLFLAWIILNAPVESCKSHTWHYDEDGWLRCKVCKKKAFNDD